MVFGVVHSQLQTARLYGIPLVNIYAVNEARYARANESSESLWTAKG